VLAVEDVEQADEVACLDARRRVVDDVEREVQPRHRRGPADDPGDDGARPVARHARHTSQLTARGGAATAANPSTSFISSSLTRDRAAQTLACMDEALVYGA